MGILSAEAASDPQKQPWRGERARTVERKVLLNEKKVILQMSVFAELDYCRILVVAEVNPKRGMRVVSPILHHFCVRSTDCLTLPNHKQIVYRWQLQGAVWHDCLSV